MNILNKYKNGLFFSYMNEFFNGKVKIHFFNYDAYCDFLVFIHKTYPDVNWVNGSLDIPADFNLYRAGSYYFCLFYYIYDNHPGLCAYKIELPLNLILYPGLKVASYYKNKK